MAQAAQVSDDELDALRQRAQAAEGRAATAETVAAKANNAAQTEFEKRVAADETAAEAAITAADAEATRLEGEYATAMEEGKFADAAKAQRMLARAEQAKANAENRKADIAAFRERARAEAEARATAQPARTNGEADLSHLSQPQQAWIRSHPQFISDPKYQRKAIALATYAADVEGIPVDSPEYFKYVEDRMHPKAAAAEPEPDADADTEDGVTITPDEEPDVIETPRPQRAAPAAAAAPVSRRSPMPTTPARNGRVTLTAQQAEAALASFPDEKPADAYRMYAEGQKTLRARGVPGF